MGTKHHRWTEEELEVVRRDYSGDRLSLESLASRLGVTVFAVKGQVQHLGLAKITDRQHWTDQEDQQLLELIPTIPIPLIAKRMHRSVFSVTVRAKRLGISSRNREGWYTQQEVSEILGVDHRWVQKRIDNGTLKAAVGQNCQPAKTGGGYWRIKQSDLKQFIRCYPEELMARNVDFIQVVEILAGVIGRR